MGIFGNYDGQAIPNMQASRAARAKVIIQGEQEQERLRASLAVSRAAFSGNGRLINIHV